MGPLKNLGSALRRRTRQLPELRNPKQIDPVRNSNDTKQIHLNYGRQIDPKHRRQTDPNYGRQRDPVQYQNYSTKIDPVRNLKYKREDQIFDYNSRDSITPRSLKESLRGGRRVNPSANDIMDPDYWKITTLKTTSYLSL
ncbi:hypothetical protein FRX31_004552 [Thalictrum thalictroides]|uniref:Uncharacterized protein n=1 Tax=Thalictrum thalictroides TaxID=46969 RepID=A0A7J6X7V4_THATH|nr:hypothetical protein FRX31_004552 [Thalictrum thalictroides]